MIVEKIDWITKGMIQSPITEVKSKISGDMIGFQFGYRNQFSHGTRPLGWLREFNITLDGKEINKEDIFFIIRNQWFPAWQIPTLRDVWLQFCEEFTIFIRTNERLTNSTYELGVEVLINSVLMTADIDSENLYPLNRFATSEKLSVAASVIEVEVPYEK